MMFLIKSWIYHSQSRSSILDLMAACNEVRPWALGALGAEGAFKFASKGAEDFGIGRQDAGFGFLV
jgi:hypothetical protein